MALEASSTIRFSESSWTSIDAYLSCRSWSPVDVASLNPVTATRLGALPFCQIVVRASSCEFVLLAVLDGGVQDGDILLPSWLGFFLSTYDGFSVDVQVLSNGDVVNGESDADRQVYASLELEGPFMSASSGVLKSPINLSRSDLGQILTRQILRTGVLLVSGAILAIRIAGEVCVFRVHTLPVVQLSNPNESNSIVLCKPSSFTIRQPLSTFLHKNVLTCQDDDLQAAATRCIADMNRAGLLRQDHVNSQSKTSDSGSLLFEGAPPPGDLLTFLHHLQSSLLAKGGIVAHFPIMEILWELPPTRNAQASSQTLHRLLSSFIHNTLLSRASTGPRVLVLWGLDSAGPEKSGVLLKPSISLLHTLKSQCILLGLCFQPLRVLSDLRPLFDNGEMSSEKLDLGLGRNFRSRDVRSLPDQSQRKLSPTVIGSDQVLGQLRDSIINYFEQPQLFSDMGISWPPRVLLHGPAGSGKTHIVQWLCAQLPVEVRTQWLHPGEVLSRYVGESEERLRATFSQALEANTGNGCVLVLEGLDQLAPSTSISANGGNAKETSGFQDRLAATLLVCLDGIDAPGPRGLAKDYLGLAVVATSSMPADMLDPRITRPGRMDRWISIDTPEGDCCFALLRHFILANKVKDSNEGVDGGILVDPIDDERRSILKSTVGMTPGRLRLVAMKAWDRVQKSGSIPTWHDIVVSSMNTMDHCFPPAGVLDAHSGGEIARSKTTDLSALDLLERAVQVPVPDDDDDDSDW